MLLLKPFVLPFRKVARRHIARIDKPVFLDKGLWGGIAYKYYVVVIHAKIPHMFVGKQCLPAEVLNRMLIL